MGQVTLPSTGSVYLDTVSVIDSVEQSVMLKDLLSQCKRACRQSAAGPFAVCVSQSAPWSVSRKPLLTR